MAKKLTDATFGLSGAAPPLVMLLDAARQVFGERGFSGSSFAEAMKRAGADADSRYCHLVPMDELFVMLWEDHQAAHAEAVSAAVAQARQSGVTDPGELFETGARAFLAGSWRRRDLGLLFSSGDAPPGFAAMQQHRHRAWLRRNAMVLRLDDSPEDRLYAASLTSLIGRGAREVATVGDFRQAVTMIDAVIRYARLLIADRPKPSANDPRERQTERDVPSRHSGSDLR